MMQRKGSCGRRSIQVTERKKKKMVVKKDEAMKSSTSPLIDMMEESEMLKEVLKRERKGVLKPARDHQSIVKRRPPKQVSS